MSVTCDICGQEFKDTRGLSGHKQFKHSGESQAKTESKAVMRGQPLDNVIENLRLPQVPEAFNGNYNVYVAGFNDGVMHGARSILAGIRAAQELSTMGIAQARPLISMASEMRQAEGQAAQEMAAYLGQAIREGNTSVLGALNNLASQKQPSETNPMAGMMIRLIEPHFQQMLNNMMGMFMGPMGAGPMPPQPGQPPAQHMAGPAPMPYGQPPAKPHFGNVRTVSGDEFEEVWDD